MAIATIGTTLLALNALKQSSGALIKQTQDTAKSVGRTYNLLTTTSVSQSAGRVLIAPMVAIQQDLVHQEWMTDLITVINLRDIKDVLTHLAYQGQVSGISISSIVDKVNPRRSGFMSLAGAESFGGQMNYLKIAGNEAAPQNQESKAKVVAIGSPKDSELAVAIPLAVGRTVQAVVQIDGTQVTFPLNFRQVPVPVSSNDLETIFKAAKPKDGFWARFKMAEAGELTSPELLTGIDQIREEFGIRTADMSGYYKEATERQSRNRKAAVMTGEMSMNTMANTIVLSADTARQIEIEHGIRFNKSGIAKIREAVLANTIVICDDGLGVFTIWNSGSSMPEEYTRRELSGMSKKDTSLDLASLMKMFGGR